jgi:ABC-type proline/glycine betaine transport system permease subunit
MSTAIIAILIGLSTGIIVAEVRRLRGAIERGRK